MPAETAMESPLINLEPRLVWQCFDQIRRVPRPSKHEERIVEHVRSWAASHGFAVRADAAGNLVVAVAASPGCESAPTVVLQTHLDMVCEKSLDSAHDFDRDPIAVTVEGDWVTAVGTTLGADNGLGAAAAMAVAIDDTARHGPLELLFTLDEETGLNGAQALDPSLVSGRLLLNLDTEEDDAVYIGCAGAAGVFAELPLKRAANAFGEGLFGLTVRGLRGGHSGMDILDNRGNAIKLVARLLNAARRGGVELGLIAMDGGSKANALPRDCRALLNLSTGSRAALIEVIHEVEEDLRAEFGAVEPALKIELEGCEGEGKEGWAPLLPASRDRFLRLLDALPHGVLAMSREVQGLVETSNNLAVVSTSQRNAILQCSLRSSVNAALRGTIQRLRSLAELAGARVHEHVGYPGWKPDPSSPLVERGVAVYEQLFGRRPGVKAVHAGLECGILVEKLRGLDAISIGPEIRGAHSPDERARISSTEKFYRFLKSLLAELAGSSEPV